MNSHPRDSTDSVATLDEPFGTFTPSADDSSFSSACASSNSELEPFVKSLSLLDLAGHARRLLDRTSEKSSEAVSSKQLQGKPNSPKSAFKKRPSHLPGSPTNSSEVQKLNTTIQVIKKTPKSVRFDSITLQEHALTVGDWSWNDGPPIALAWERVASYQVSLEDYEQRRCHRRAERELRLSGGARRAMLKEFLSDSQLGRAKTLKRAISGTKLNRLSSA